LKLENEISKLYGSTFETAGMLLMTKLVVQSAPSAAMLLAVMPELENSSLPPIIEAFYENPINVR
jgi:hypothetical protein